MPLRLTCKDGLVTLEGKHEALIEGKVTVTIPDPEIARLMGEYDMELSLDATKYMASSLLMKLGDCIAAHVVGTLPSVMAGAKKPSPG